MSLKRPLNELIPTNQTKVNQYFIPQPKKLKLDGSPENNGAMLRRSVSLPTKPILNRAALERSHSLNDDEKENSITEEVKTAFLKDNEIVHLIRSKKLTPREAMKVILEKLPNRLCANDNHGIFGEIINKTGFFKRNQEMEKLPDIFFVKLEAWVSDRIFLKVPVICISNCV